MRWNPLDSRDDAQELAGRFAAVMQIVNPSGKDDTFWIDSARALIQNLITLIRLARPEEPPSLVELYEAATSDAELARWGRADRRRNLRGEPNGDAGAGLFL